MSKKEYVVFSFGVVFFFLFVAIIYFSPELSQDDTYIPTSGIDSGGLDSDSDKNSNKEKKETDYQPNKVEFTDDNNPKT